MRLRAFLTSFTSAFLCFIIVWMAALMLIKPRSYAKTSAVPETDTAVYLPESSDCMTMLLCEKTDSPTLFSLLRFDPVDGKISVFSFPKRLVLELDSVSEPAEKIFISQGISGISKAVSQTFGITAKKYLMIERPSLSSLLDLFEPTPISLDKDFAMTANGISLTLKKGLQLLDGQRLLCWLVAEAPTNDIEQCEFLSRITADIINCHTSLLESDNSQELFGAVVNSSDTDLVFSDYDSRRLAAAFMAQLCDKPAQAVTFEFERNPDATLSLSSQSSEKLARIFS